MSNYRKKKVKGVITTGVLILTFSAVMLSGCAKSEKKKKLHHPARTGIKEI